MKSVSSIPAVRCGTDLWSHDHHLPALRKLGGTVIHYFSIGRLLHYDMYIYVHILYVHIYIYILILLLLLLLLLLYVNSTKIGWIFDKHIEIAGWKNGSFFQDCCLQHGPRSWSYTVCRTCHGRVLASFSQIARAEAQFSQSEGKHQWTRVGKMDRSFPRSHGHWKKASVPFRFPDGPQRKKTLADSLVEAGYGGAISNGVWALIFYGLNRKNKKLLCGGYCISMIYGGCKVP